MFRGLLAMAIGTFMAQPALLFIFKKEIWLQISLDNQKKLLVKSGELTVFYKGKKIDLSVEKDILKKELDNNYASVAKARENFLAETDGSGGTGKVGVKDVALAKKNEYQKLDAEYHNLSGINQPKILEIETELKSIDQTISNEEAGFTRYFNDGFLTQIEALNNLLKDNPALQLRYYLLLIILLLIELMPVIAKTMLPSGTYDEKAMLREALEKEIAQINIIKEKKLKELYHTLSAQNDAETMTAFFEVTKDARAEKIKLISNKWINENGKTFAGLWKTLKKELLTGQEL